MLLCWRKWLGRRVGRSFAFLLRRSRDDLFTRVSPAKKISPATDETLKSDYIPWIVVEKKKQAKSKASEQSVVKGERDETGAQIEKAKRKETETPTPRLRRRKGRGTDMRERQRERRWR